MQSFGECARHKCDREIIRISMSHNTSGSTGSISASYRNPTAPSDKLIHAIQALLISCSVSLSLSRSTFDLPNAFLVLLSSFGPALNVHLIAPPPIRLTATRRLGPTVSDKLSSGCLNSRVRSTKSQSKIDANKVIRGTSPIQKEHARVTAREIIFSRLEPDGRVESNGGLLFLRSCALPLGGTWAPCPHALKLKTATQATHTLTVTCMAIGLSSAMLVSILSLTDLKSQTTQLLQAVSFNTSSHRGLVRQ